MLGHDDGLERRLFRGLLDDEVLDLLFFDKLLNAHRVEGLMADRAVLTKVVNRSLADRTGNRPEENAPHSKGQFAIKVKVQSTVGRKGQTIVGVED